MRELKPRVGPSGPHRFVEPEDTQLGAALGAGHSPNLAMTWTADTTERSGRTVRCAACGKERRDQIHLPPD
jgi:hypothetical protein